jgi:hypothetical protein
MAFPGHLENSQNGSLEVEVAEEYLPVVAVEIFKVVRNPNMRWNTKYTGLERALLTHTT